jgi:glycosyltransferase involved in cell wall biosynthesis
MEALLDEWRRRGHETALMCGGPVSFRRPGIHLARRTFGDTPTFEIVNTPNRVGDDDDPLAHLRHPDLGGIVEAVLDAYAPDVIHAFEIESLSGDVLRAGIERGIRTVAGLHNYWYLCSQRDLFLGDGSTCTDFLDGRACTSCRVIHAPGRLHVRAKQAARSVDGLAWMQQMVRSARRIRARVPLSAGRVAGPKPAAAGDYVERRRGFVDMLGRIDALLPASARVAAIHEQHGVDPARMFPLHSVRSWLDSIRPKQPVTPAVVSFGYLGNLDEHKGAWTLLEAARRVRGTFSLHVHCEARPQERVRLERMAGGLPVVIHGPYRGDDLPRILEGIDVGVVPSRWEEALGMTAMELGLSHTPVIASRIGGLEEQVRDGETGVLVEPGSVSGLAEAMQGYVDDPDLVRAHMSPERTRWSPGAYVDRWEEIVG